MIMKQYIKDGITYQKPQFIYLKDSTVINPSDEILLKAGYEIREVEIPEPTPYQPTYEDRVVELIRLRYSIDNELAIQRQRDSKPEEFSEYNAYCEECKQRAKEDN